MGTVSVCLLGGFTAAIDDVPVPETAWRLKKARELVKLLALAPGHRARSMSSYLVTPIESTPNIAIRTRTEVIDADGGRTLQSLTLASSGVVEEVPARALFIMIGGEPHTQWLPSEIARDSAGYILTGRDVLQAPGRQWTERREPLLLETSMPGVFAAGDVRHASIKRVASAVGDGATAVRLVHEYLRED